MSRRDQNNAWLVTLPDDRNVDVTLRRSRQAKRISLRIAGIDGRVVLTLPHGVPQAQAEAFLADKRDWLFRNLDRVAPQITVDIGQTIPVEGKPTEIKSEGPCHGYDDTGLYVPRNTRVGKSTAAILKTMARDRLVAASDLYSARIGRDYHKISLRDTRSRWGSCSSRGDLMYSWRLIMAPPEVLDYVAAHEVAHLVHMNHSKAFWAQVAELFPNHREPRQWLREHGVALHRYRFDST